MTNGTLRYSPTGNNPILSLKGSVSWDLALRFQRKILAVSVRQQTDRYSVLLALLLVVPYITKFMTKFDSIHRSIYIPIFILNDERN